MKIPTFRTYLIGLFTLTLLSGCKHLVHLDRAQDAFNQGATLENTQRFNPSAALEGADNPAAIRQLSEQNLVSGSPEAYYNLAYSELNKALQSKNRLESDSVLPSALSLRALTEWKLGKPRQAIATADEALAAMNATGIELPRDKAVMTAMRGLVAMDLGFEASQELEAIKNRQIEGSDSDTPGATYQNAKNLYQDRIWGTQENEGNIRLAFDRIESAKAIPGDGHPVQGYLVLSQMSGLKTWGDSIALLFDLSDRAGQTDNDWLRDQYCAYDEWKENLQLQLNDIAGDSESAQLVRSMNFYEDPGIRCN